MIITQMMGGLGNQMFQYALGRKLALKNKDQMKMDISGYTTEYSKERPFQLTNFNIIENIATPKEIQSLKYPYGPISLFVRALKSRILKIRNVRFKPNVLKKTGDTYLSGFWQSEKYFADIAQIIRQDFKLRRKMSHSAEIACEKILKSPVSVSIHIRRGDYVQDSKTNNYHGTCSSTYYQKALNTIVKELGDAEAKKIQLFVFSDDMAWTKKYLSFPYPTIFVSKPSIPDYEELVLMSKCSHHIIANSSFSWWGAWLNPNPNKIVVAPAKWFNTKPSTYKDVVPKSWIKI